MLSQLSDSSDEKLQNCFDSLFFINKMLELTYENLNTFRINTEKLMKEEEGKQVESKGDSLALPTTLDGWVQYEFPNELIDKLLTNTENNIICKFAFAYPELTLHYLLEVIKNFEAFGLDSHNIVLMKFAQLLVGKLLNNKYLGIGVNLKYARCLSCLGYQKLAKEILDQQIPLLKISDQEHQVFFEGLERLVPRGGMDSIHGSSGIKLRG